MVTRIPLCTLIASKVQRPLNLTLNWTVDDVEVEGNVQPLMLHDKVLIPVEKLFNEAGFKVSTDESGKVNVTNTHLTVDFDAAAGEIKVNGEKATTNSLR